jgi:hypothetical protein
VRAVREEKGHLAILEMVDYRKVVLLVICLIHSAVFSFFLAKEDLDLRYLTYINYTMLTSFFIFLLFVSKKENALSLTMATLFSIEFNLAVFIGIAIVLIVQLNDWVFTRTTVVHMGPRKVGDVHTGDWILHQFTVVTIFVVFLMYMKEARKGFGLIRKNATRFGLVLYYIFLISFPSLIILLYFVTEDTSRNYPVDSLSNWVTLVLSLILSNLIGGFFVLLLHPCNKVVD